MRYIIRYNPAALQIFLSFHFHAVFSKKMPNNRLALPLFCWRSHSSGEILDPPLLTTVKFVIREHPPVKKPLRTNLRYWSFSHMDTLSTLGTCWCTVQWGVHVWQVFTAFYLQRSQQGNSCLFLLTSESIWSESPHCFRKYNRQCFPIPILHRCPPVL